MCPSLLSPCQEDVTISGTLWTLLETVKKKRQLSYIFININNYKYRCHLIYYVEQLFVRPCSLLDTKFNICPSRTDRIQVERVAGPWAT